MPYSLDGCSVATYRSGLLDCEVQVLGRLGTYGNHYRSVGSGHKRYLASCNRRSCKGRRIIGHIHIDRSDVRSGNIGVVTLELNLAIRIVKHKACRSYDLLKINILGCGQDGGFVNGSGNGGDGICTDAFRQLVQHLDYARTIVLAYDVHVVGIG